MADSDLVESGDVFRLAFCDAEFPPDSKRMLPKHLSFTDDDKAEDPPYLSVWDMAQTTVAAALTHSRPGRIRVAFQMPVAGIMATTAADGTRPLTVRRRPIAGDGGDGHCGIFGLWNHANLKTLRALLTHLATRLDAPAS